MMSEQQKDEINTLFIQAFNCHKQGRLEKAAALYSAILEIQAHHHDALHLLGVCYSQVGQYDQAVLLISKAIALEPTKESPYYNLGIAFSGLKQFDQAVLSYDKAILLNPHFLEAYLNKACALESLNQLTKAILIYDEAIKIKPDNPKAHYERATLWVKLRDYDKAASGYNDAVQLNPEYPLLYGYWLHAKMQICVWDELEKNMVTLVEYIQQNKRVATCFVLEALIDDPHTQKLAAQIWIDSMYPINNKLGLEFKKSKDKNKIRIGYYSADFKNHPVSFLMAGLFEQHDKNKFEIIAFSFGIKNQDKIRLRIEAACDQFIDVSDQTDLAIAELSRTLEIDIAVDLVGLTANARTGIFAYRVAPIQMSYLGYLGTMGAPYFDYVLADKTLIPKEMKKHYVEKILYVPHYQVNDDQRTVIDIKVTKQELGLPQDKFVFCCLNNTFKITPLIFACWMRILKQVPHSVLLLYADRDSAILNLKKQALMHGVEPGRLFFAKHAPFYEYMLRLSVSDLFLDTLPYNAGTTASDAVWVGLPILTCAGKSFASRMAASVLSSLDLPELMTSSLPAYEERAIFLATHPEQLQKIKARLEKNRITSPLFKTKEFVRHLEVAYSLAHDRYQKGLAPEDIEVS